MRRNSTLFDMLFVVISHPLSASIYTLDEKCKQLTDKGRAEVKEKINPNLRFVSPSFRAEITAYQLWILYVQDTLLSELLGSHLFTSIWKN